MRFAKKGFIIGYFGAAVLLIAAPPLGFTLIGALLAFLGVRKLVRRRRARALDRQSMQFVRDDYPASGSGYTSRVTPQDRA